MDNDTNTTNTTNTICNLLKTEKDFLGNKTRRKIEESENNINEKICLISSNYSNTSKEEEEKDKEKENYTYPKESIKPNIFNVIRKSQFPIKANSEKIKKPYRKLKYIIGEFKAFTCNVCGKKYVCYTALYTHKRNIHNVIPVSKKQEIFKKKVNLKNHTKTFSYKSIGYGMSINPDFFDDLKNKIQNNIKNFYGKYKNTLFIDKDFYENSLNGNHFLINYLEKYKNLFSKKIKIPEPRESISIEEIFTVYFILYSRVVNSEKFIEQILKFILLFREFINTVGWDYYKKSMISEFETEEIKSDFFSENDFVNYLPDFVNEFFDKFLLIDENKFGFSEKPLELEDLCLNFFNWLFNNNFTNLKISQINFDSDLA